MLSHYDAVVWYTGDDVVTREPGWGPGNASRLAMQELLEVRDYVNEGGRVLYTGQRAGQQYTTGSRHAALRPVREPAVQRRPGRRGAAAWPFGSGDSQGDPIEYLFGAAITTPDGGTDPETGEPFDVAGIDEPLERPVVGDSTAPTAPRIRSSNSSFIATGDFLQVTDPADSFPQFESWPAAEYLSGLSGPFDPHTGQSFMWSDRADEAYKRLSRTIDVPAGGATLSFWTSYNLELDFDYMIVEAHTVGQDNWTTLPDQNGHTSSDLSRRSGVHGRLEQSRRRGQRAAPVPEHYQTFDPATGECSAARSGTRRGSGTPPTAARAAGSSSRSTSRGTWASRSRSRSPR